VTCLGSDHSTVVPKADKVNTSIWDAVPGFPGMGMLLPIMLSEGYHRGRISLEQLAGVLCRNNAQVYGIYPRKGAIRVGSDRRLARPWHLRRATPRLTSYASFDRPCCGR
jgi:dihydroorotase-like cyclic amidohydrolase